MNIDILITEVKKIYGNIQIDMYSLEQFLYAIQKALSPMNIKDRASLKEVNELIKDLKDVKKILTS